MQSGEFQIVDPDGYTVRRRSTRRRLVATTGQRRIEDGVELVRTTCGHPDGKLARERVRQAFRAAPTAPVSLFAKAG
jgi:hypothetical protein